MSEEIKSKISVRFQTAIPKEIRFFLKLKEGDYLIWKRENGKIIVERGV